MLEQNSVLLCGAPVRGGCGVAARRSTCDIGSAYRETGAAAPAPATYATFTKKSEAAPAPRDLLRLQLVARGYSLEQMALLLQTSVVDVEASLDRAAAAFGARSRLHAVAIACRRRLIG